MTLADLMKYVTKRERLERITFIGPMELGQQVLDCLHANGWHIVHSGPYTSKRMFPKVDDKRFLFVMERELEDEGVESTHG